MSLKRHLQKSSSICTALFLLVVAYALFCSIDLGCFLTNSEILLCSSD